MRYAFSLALAMILASVLAAPALAGDGHVPQSTLDSLGLAGMQPVSDEEGMQVRGMSGAARVMGISLVSGLVLEPSTKSFVFGSDANFVMANGATVCCRGRIDVFKDHLSYVELQLSTSDAMGGIFEGSLYGGAGGTGHAWVK